MSIHEISSDIPLITSDATTFGVLMSVLLFVFYTSDKSSFQRFYTFVPTVLACYFLPSLFCSLGVISSSWIDVTSTINVLKENGFNTTETKTLAELKSFISTNNVPSELYEQFIGHSNLYYMASRFLLPAGLILLTLSINLKEVINLGPKALITFFAGTLGVMIGGPICILLVKYFSLESMFSIEGNEVWRGMTTVAGSWIGGGANQTAMKEIFNVNDTMFSVMVTVDIIVAEVWMAFILLGIGKNKKINTFLKADDSSIEILKERMQTFSKSITKVSLQKDFIFLIGLAFLGTGLAHQFGDVIAPFIKTHFPQLEKASLSSKFFWIIIISTFIGLFLSFTKARKLEGVGASKLGGLFIYILVVVIGMKMNVMALFENLPFFLLGAIWMSIHILVIFIVAKIIKAPYFFVAVGSKANIGGAATAPIVAASFHPSLATVGVLLAVLGYAVGTFGAYFTGLLMQYLWA